MSDGRSLKSEHPARVAAAASINPVSSNDQPDHLQRISKDEAVSALVSARAARSRRHAAASRTRRRRMPDQGARWLAISRSDTITGFLSRATIRRRFRQRTIMS